MTAEIAFPPEALYIDWVFGNVVRRVGKNIYNLAAFIQVSAKSSRFAAYIESTLNVVSIL